MISSNRPQLFPALIVSLPLLFNAGSPVSAAADDWHRPNQDLSKWERTGENLIWGFSKYQPCVREFPVRTTATRCGSSVGSGYRQQGLSWLRRDLPCPFQGPEKVGGVFRRRTLGTPP